MIGADETNRLSKIIITTTFIVIRIFHANGYSEKDDNLIYILIWTTIDMDPFRVIDMGGKAFESCSFKNCFLTADHSYLKNILDFDVLMFNVWQLSTGNLQEGILVPTNRSELQKYGMYAVEPAGFHELSVVWNEFFNFTFTYKLSSNVTIPYIVIKDERDRVIGPKVDMQWMKLSEMNDTSDYVKRKLNNKHLAAAWIVSHCQPPWRRLYAEALRKELDRYGHNLHVFGKCGDSVQCPRNERVDECFALVESDYYFYLSFENSFGEDYVTEKILHALEHFAVPVVFGGGNYSRFMPNEIYLNGNNLAPDKMAEKMNEIINNKTKYYEFFKWHDHYSFHFSGEDGFRREICGLCAYLNKSRNQTGILDNIALWWNVELPPWPEDFDTPNDVEKIVSKFLNFLDPSSE